MVGCLFQGLAFAIAWRMCPYLQYPQSRESPRQTPLRGRFRHLGLDPFFTGLIYLGSLNPIPFGGMASWVWRWRFVGYLVVKKFNNCIHRTNLSVNHHYSNGVMFKQFLIKAYVFFSYYKQQAVIQMNSVHYEIFI